MKQTKKLFSGNNSQHSKRISKCYFENQQSFDRDIMSFIRITSKDITGHR